jgi:hypothetical protein
MPHSGGHDETAKLFCLVDLDHHIAARRDLDGSTDLGRLVDWHRTLS